VLALALARYGDSIAVRLKDSFGQISLAAPAPAMIVLFVALAAMLGMGAGLLGAMRGAPHAAR
jgi:hypothetical protein